MSQKMLNFCLKKLKFQRIFIPHVFWSNFGIFRNVDFSRFYRASRFCNLDYLKNENLNNFKFCINGHFCNICRKLCRKFFRIIFEMLAFTLSTFYTPAQMEFRNSQNKNCKMAYPLKIELFNFPNLDICFQFFYF